VDHERFRPATAAEKRVLRSRWRLPLDARIVLHVGHLVPARNLEALARLAALPNSCVVLLASHVRVAESESIERTLRECGVVIFSGYRPHVEELYRAADCYVFPSHAWGGGIDLPLSVLEAMASDLPVASTPFGALPDWFTGVPGVRFGNSFDELSQAVESLLRSKPHTRNLVERFTWDALAASVLEVLAPRAAPGWNQPLSTGSSPRWPIRIEAPEKTPNAV
jgi:glycosyltransferase involved in cell wall biosynthesis